MRRASRGGSGGGQVAEVGIVGGGENAGGCAVAGDDGEGAVGQAQFAGPADAQAEQGGQVDANGDVVRDHQQGLAGVGVEQPFQDGGDAVVDLLQGLAAGVGAVRRVGQEGGVGCGVVLAYFVPGEALPAAQVALGQRFQELRCQAVWGGDDGGSLDGAAQWTAPAAAQGDAGKTVASRLGLEDSEGSERRVAGPSLQSGRMGEVRLRHPVAHEVKQKRGPPVRKLPSTREDDA
jgi:hypothetical protein